MCIKLTRDLRVFTLLQEHRRNIPVSIIYTILLQAILRDCSNNERSWSVPFPGVLVVEKNDAADDATSLTSSWIKMTRFLSIPRSSKNWCTNVAPSLPYGLDARTAICQRSIIHHETGHRKRGRVTIFKAANEFCLGLLDWGVYSMSVPCRCYRHGRLTISGTGVRGA